MATNAAPLVEEEPRRERVALLPLVVWLIAVAILGFTEFGIYWLCGFLGAGCPTYEGQMGPGRLIGGPASHGAVLTAGARLDSPTGLPPAPQPVGSAFGCDPWPLRFSLLMG